MPLPDPSPDRRRFLRLMLGFSTTALLAGCHETGPGGGLQDTQSASTTGELLPLTAPLQPAHPLNLVLNLAYLGAQYYSYAAHGSGLTADLLPGVGPQGVALGARQAALTDPLIAAYATEGAADKQQHVAALRKEIGALAAAQPQLDLSTANGSAFAFVGRATGVAPAGGFDPYANDESFLFGAFLFENVVAATYRTLLAQLSNADAFLQAQLADAIYHGGLVRALLDDKAATSPEVAAGLTTIGSAFAILDGSNVGNQTLAGASGISSNILDADDRPIPFTRANSQILAALYLSTDGSFGGFLPAGANGVLV